MATTRATHRHAIHCVTLRFRPRSYARGYTRCKLRLDPAYGAIADALGDSRLPLLDIGCGMGLLGLYLHERGLCPDYLGVDIDPRKLRDGIAAIGAASATLRLREGDAARLPAHNGHVVLLDVLHYLSPAVQEGALRGAAARVAPGGLLLVRTCLADRSWRHRATVAEEWLLHASGWMRSDGTRNMPRREQVELALRREGFKVTSRPLWGLTPFNSHLFVAGRGAAVSAA